MPVMSAKSARDRPCSRRHGHRKAEGVQSQGQTQRTMPFSPVRNLAAAPMRAAPAGLSWRVDEGGRTGCIAPPIETAAGPDRSIQTHALVI